MAAALGIHVGKQDVPISSMVLFCVTHLFPLSGLSSGGWLRNREHVREQKNKHLKHHINLFFSLSSVAAL